MTLIYLLYFCLIGAVIFDILLSYLLYSKYKITNELDKNTLSNKALAVLSLDSVFTASICFLMSQIGGFSIWFISFIMIRITIILIVIIYSIVTGLIIPKAKYFSFLRENKDKTSGHLKEVTKKKKNKD